MWRFRYSNPEIIPDTRRERASKRLSRSSEYLSRFIKLERKFCDIAMPSLIRGGVRKVGNVARPFTLPNIRQVVSGVAARLASLKNRARSLHVVDLRRAPSDAHNFHVLSRH